MDMPLAVVMTWFYYTYSYLDINLLIMLYSYLHKGMFSRERLYLHKTTFGTMQRNQEEPPLAQMSRQPYRAASTQPLDFSSRERGRVELGIM